MRVRPVAGEGGGEEDVEETEHHAVRAAGLVREPVLAAERVVQSCRGLERHAGIGACLDEAREGMARGEGAFRDAPGAHLGAGTGRGEDGEPRGEVIVDGKLDVGGERRGNSRQRGRRGRAPRRA